MNEIIRLLKQHRIDRNLNQGDFGNKLGMPQSHISKIEKGGTDPRLSTITDMARLLDQELILVPREMLHTVRAFINGENLQKPLWSLEEDDS